MKNFQSMHLGEILGQSIEVGSCLGRPARFPHKHTMNITKSYIAGLDLGKGS